MGFFRIPLLSLPLAFLTYFSYAADMGTLSTSSNGETSTLYNTNPLTNHSKNEDTSSTSFRWVRTIPINGQGNGNNYTYVRSDYLSFTKAIGEVNFDETTIDSWALNGEQVHRNSFSLQLNSQFFPTKRYTCNYQRQPKQYCKAWAQALFLIYTESNKDYYEVAIQLWLYDYYHFHKKCPNEWLSSDKRDCYINTARAAKSLDFDPKRIHKISLLLDALRYQEKVNNRWEPRAQLNVSATVTAFDNNNPDKTTKQSYTLNGYTDDFLALAYNWRGVEFILAGVRSALPVAYLSSPNKGAALSTTVTLEPGPVYAIKTEKNGYTYERNNLINTKPQRVTSTDGDISFHRTMHRIRP
ncbi:hypothetical protein [Candidatus Albibeggiatoa sp. nov. NOAA]|uniref:hypothetical protein n=1 Tax=Candidatus Albibeggiatoa sp. nov. NOAA TaxID=3162724 RepID=UPI0033038300|nr:hypothetical protein [Thiotrichaceae bacterium]